MAAERKLYLIVNGAEYELADTFETEQDDVVASTQSRVERLLKPADGGYPSVRTGASARQQFPIRTERGIGTLYVSAGQATSAALILGAPQGEPRVRRLR
jgi:hypothetical protein